MLGELSWPGTALLDQLMSDQVTLCKCEEVKVGTFIALLENNSPSTTASAAKLFSRVGMGLCQGRYCQFSVIRLMARRLGLPEQSVGSFTSRFPAKPIEIGDLVDCEN